MSNVLPFPLTQRDGFAQRIARRMTELQPAAGENHLQRSLVVQAETMARRRIAPALIARECQALEAAVRAALWSIVLGRSA